MMIRKPAVAGQFYPASDHELSDQVNSFMYDEIGKERVIGIVSPHAGLIYSGAVAGAVYSRIEPPHSVILMGPNHTGVGQEVSILSSGQWEMPTGSVKVDEELASRLKDKTSLVTDDSLAHSMEHSLEVQLPFLFHLSKDIQIVPICLGTDSLETCKSLGDAIADVISESSYNVTIIASSDMSHYETDAAVREKDKKAIEKIISMDPEGLYNTVRRERISMCGVIPAATMLYGSLKLGASKAELIKYMTSGEVSGDYDYVVGYAGIIVK